VAACEKCAAQTKDVFYTREGEAVCRKCFATDQTAAADERAIASVQEEQDQMLRIAGYATEVKLKRAQPGNETSIKAIVIGGILVALGLGLGLATWIAMERVIGVAFVVVILGIVTLYQGVRLRREGL